MSRGRPRGGGSGRGGRGAKAGPATPWTANESASPAGPATKEREARTMPAPKFPAVVLPLPSPLTASEKSSVAHYRSFRSRMRDGPLYAVLDRSEMLDDDGKPGVRRGWNAFEGMEREGWSARYRRGRRGMPDLRAFRESIKDEAGEGGFALPFFPRELWSTLDPERTHSAWKTIHPSQSLKRSRSSSRSRSRSSHSSDADADADPDQPPSQRRRRAPASPTLERLRLKSPPPKKSQKKGLEAEDDIGPDEGDGQGQGLGLGQQEDDGEVEAVLEDSAFEESDDGAGDDYNAENYFDGGDDDDGGAGGFDDGGGAGEGGKGDDSGYY